MHTNENWKYYKDRKQQEAINARRIDESLDTYNEDDDVSDLTTLFKEYIDE